MIKVRETAKKLGEEIKNTDVYKDFYAQKFEYENNTELQNLIGNFNLIRQNLIEESKKENNDEKIQAMQQEMNTAYKSIMENDNMKKFIEIKKDFDDMVKEVYDIINYHITGEEPNSCESGCSSCSGCH